MRATVPAPVPVNIDVKPGSDPNCFNITGHGVIPVAILGSDTFDVTNVDLTSLSFGGLQVRIRGNRGPLCSVEDCNDDGFMDLVCHFEDDSTNWDPGDGDATLTGNLFDGTAFEGSDSSQSPHGFTQIEHEHRGDSCANRVVIDRNSPSQPVQNIFTDSFGPDCEHPFIDVDIFQ